MAPRVCMLSVYSWGTRVPSLVVFIVLRRIPGYSQSIYPTTQNRVDTRVQGEVQSCSCEGAHERLATPSAP